MKIFTTHIFEKIQASAWTIPTVLSISAIALAQFSLWADGELDTTQVPILSELQGSTPEGARAFLSTIATSMLAIAGVSFSSIMVTITLASQQFGPRLLRNFIKDKFSQTVLGILLGTFIYCIFIIRRTHDAGMNPFVPQISTAIALVLALLCLGSFIRFVHHIISRIQAEEVVADAYQVLEASVDAIFPNEGSKKVEYRSPGNEFSGWGIKAGKTGYLQAVNLDSLVEVARKYDAVLETRASSGDFLTQNQITTCIVEGPEEEGAPESFIQKVQESFFVGSVRTPEQDFEYGIRQLVEVALRALSPGINDPFTAMNCIDYLGSGLQAAFARPLPGSVHRDNDGAVRVFSPQSSYESLVEAAVNQIRQASREKCDVSCRLLEMLAKTARVSHLKEQQLALQIQAGLIASTTPQCLHCDHDRTAIEERFKAFQEACHLLE